MTQPNFLQVTNALTASVDYARSNPDRTSSSHYLSALEQMAARWEAATTETDSLYTEWRLLRGDRMREFRKLRLAYDRVLELADEHAYDDVPRRQIVYTEEDTLLELIDDTLAWIDGKGDEWAWCGEHAGTMRGLVDSALSLRADCDGKFRKYSVVVKIRVAAYGDAISLLREYLREVDSEPGTAAGAPVLDVL